MMLRIRLSLLLLIGLGIPVFAHDETEQPDKFRVTTALGYLVTTGNTETSTFKGRLDIEREVDQWLHKFAIDGLYKKSDVEENSIVVSQTTAEKYFSSLQSDYRLTARKEGSLFARGSYTQDKFSGFEYQSSISVGYSDAFFKKEYTHFTYSLGPGYSSYKNDDTSDLIVGDTVKQNAIIHVAADYYYLISENSAFTQTVSSEISIDSDKNTQSKSVTAISANIYGSLALKISYTIDHNTVVANDKKNMDTETSFTLVYTME